MTRIGLSDQVEGAEAVNLWRCEQMREAVLAKAFRGELTASEQVKL